MTWRDQLQQVPFDEWQAALPAQRFIRENGDDLPTYWIIPANIYHSSEYQDALVLAIKESTQP